MPQFTTSTYQPNQKGVSPWICIFKPDGSLLSTSLDTPENQALAEIMLDALNAAYDNLTPVDETPVTYLDEYEYQNEAAAYADSI